MSGITGSYPGGPRRHGQEEEAGQDPQAEIRDGESIEASIAARRTGRTKKRRNRRLVIGLVTSFIAAAGVGAYFGMRSITTAEDLAQEEMKEGEMDLKKQSDRLINELWKMEDLERARRP